MCGKPGHKARNVHPVAGYNRCLHRLRSRMICSKKTELGSLSLHVGWEINFLLCRLTFLWMVFAMRVDLDHGFWREMMWQLRLCSKSYSAIGLSLAPLFMWDATLCRSLLCKNLFNQNYQTYSTTIVLVCCSLTAVCGGRMISCMVDSGATHSFMTKAVTEAVG